MGRKGKGRQLSRLAALPPHLGFQQVRNSAYAMGSNRVYRTEGPSNLSAALLLGVVQEQRNQEPHKGKEQHDSRYSVQHKEA
jgi:hypothetical protein